MQLDVNEIFVWDTSSMFVVIVVYSSLYGEKHAMCVFSCMCGDMFLVTVLVCFCGVLSVLIARADLTPLFFKN